MCCLNANGSNVAGLIASGVAAATLLLTAADQPAARQANAPSYLSAQDGGLMQEGKELLQDAQQAVQDAKDLMQDELDPDAMMQAWIDANKTGEHHRMLDDMIGTFNADMTMINAPGAPPQQATGTCVNTWVLDGRYVKTEFTAVFEGMDFKGLGFTGYSNADKEFQGIWMDSMSTHIEYAKGHGHDNGLHMTTTMTDPIMGQKMKIDESFTIQSRDQHTFTRKTIAPDGTVVGEMTIVYTRAG